MSERFVTLIPVSPNFVLGPEALKEALSVFATYLPGADETIGRVMAEIAFRDQGECFERVSCPCCHRALTSDWWQDAMDKSYKTRFQNPTVVTPCCSFPTSLNDLEYHCASWVRPLLAEGARAPTYGGLTRSD